MVRESGPEVGIVSTGYWRVHFLAALLRPFARVNLFSGQEAVNAARPGIDFVLWERQVEAIPPQELDPNRLFLFDYRAEGSIRKLAARAEELDLTSPRFLLLFPRRDRDDVGPLPLPSPGRLTSGALLRPPGLSERTRDISFLCSPTFLYLSEKETHGSGDLPYVARHSQNGLSVYNQRLEWVSELRRGGLLPRDDGLIDVGKPELSPASMKELFGFDLPVFTRPVSKKQFARRLAASKISLSPAGYSRWAYRHVESMYNGALTVCTDLSRYRSLPAIPPQACIQIPDGEFSAERIQEILSDIEGYQSVADAGYDFARSTYQSFTPFRKKWLRQNYTPRAAREIAHAFLEWLQANTSSDARTR